jgi:hypothetical protein
VASVADRDLKTLTVLLDIALTSEHQGEIDNALRRARRIVRQTNLRAADFLEAVEQRFQLLDVAKGLSDEVNRLEVENERLRRNSNSNNGFAQQLWQDAGTTVSNTAKAAQWAVDLGHQGRVHWTVKEVEFLDDMARRHRLSERQQSWLNDLLRRCMQRTGEYPP